MLKIETRTLVLSLIFTFFSTVAPVVAVAQELIVIENDWPPYYFGNTTNPQAGFARELLDACLPDAGYTAEYRFYPVKRMYSYLRKGLLDIAIFSYRKDREEMVIYGREPIFTSSYRPVVLKGSAICIDSLRDFDSLRLGHLAGLRYSAEFQEYVQKREAAGRLVTITDGRDYLKLLLEGIIDVFVDTRATTLWRASRMGVTENIRILGFDIKTSDYYVTVSKASPRLEHPRVLLDTLDSCFAAMKENGKFDSIAKKYGID